MATYVLPQTLVFQEFTANPAVAANPLSAHIAGGHAHLVRESQTTERENGYLGYYDNTSDTAYSWPNQPAASAIDPNYTKLYIENALLQYRVDDISSGSMITTVSGYANRIRSATYNFKSSGTYLRDSTLYDRDVAVGDVVKVRGVPTGTGATGNSVTLWTYVQALAADTVAAVVASATVDSDNASTQSASASISQTAGDENCVISSVNGSSYDGTADGQISETYVITVTESSVGTDYTTAKLRVVSASGTDDVAEVIPAASGTAFAIGTRGLTITFSDSDTAACSLSADNDSVSYNDLIVGQEFTAVVAQSFTATTATSGGSYSSTADTTYIVEVTKGGTFATLPEVSVTTNNGIDQSGPHVVTGTGVTIPIGTDSVSIAFGASAALNLGDRFYVAVTGETDGPTRTLVLGQNLDSTFAAGDEVGIELYIRNPLLEVTANRTDFAPLTNWAQSSTEFITKSGITAYDATWTNNGTPMALPVYSASSLEYGKLYLEYRAWQSTHCSTIASISNVANINDIDGELTPDNPLKWGVYKALLNSNGTPVLYSAVCAPDDPNSWVDVLEVLTSRDDAYNLVPLTRNAAVLDLYQGHVNASSTEQEGLWRVAWFGLEGIPEIPIVAASSTVPNHTAATTTDGGEALAVFEDDPSTSGSQYTIVRVPAANAQFITNGVKAGDIVRGIYVGDGFGNFTYSEYIVEEVQTESQLHIKAGPSVAQTVPAKIEVWRNLSATEEATEIAAVAGARNDKRIRAVWPDLLESSGTTQEGYHAAAALAGLASGVLPQQGLTHIAVAGFSSVTRTNDKFNKAQLDIMAVSGVWILQQQSDGAIYTRHGVTTGDYEDINQREEMIIRNVDSISYRFKDYFDPFIGVTNVTPSMQDIILGGLDQLIRILQSERSTQQLGGQLIGATIDRFFISETFKDRYVAYITLDVPYALNNIELHLIV